MSGASLRFQGARKSYNTARGAVEAIRGIDLEVKAGSFTAIVGPSGCGKSTLLQIAAGLMEATGGGVYVDDHKVSGPPAEAIYVFQQYTKSVFPWKTAFENVAFGLRYGRASGARPSRDEIEHRCNQMLDLVGLNNFKDYYPYQLSGGMQQRVAIARALVCRPHILLMDEPFSAVDALIRSEMQDSLLDIWQKLTPTIIFVTHDVDEAIYLAENVVVLSRPPSRVSQIVHIDVPYPRDQIATRENQAVLHCRREILADIMARPSTGVL